MINEYASWSAAFRSIIKHYIDKKIRKPSSESDIVDLKSLKKIIKTFQ